MQVSDGSEFRNLALPNDDRSFIPDSAGNFSVSFKLTKPSYFRIGRNVLYLTPGDKLTVALDYNKPENGIFTESAVEANNYLRYTPFPKAGSFIEGGRKIQKNIKQSIDTILAAGKSRGKQLAKVKDITPAFRTYEEARIKADMINSLSMLRVYYPMMNHLSKEAGELAQKEVDVATASHKAQLAKGFVDPDLLKVEVYSDVADDILAVDANSPKATQIKDYLKAADLAYKIKHLATKDEVIAAKPELDAIVTPAYKNALSDVYAGLIKFGNGDKAVDFTAKTADGKKVKLSEYAGKVVFVDLWATWCGPCIAEMPALEKLKERYKDNPNIVFLSISIDDNKEAWKKMLGTMNISGTQLVTDRSDLNAYSVIDIPRTIIIDKDMKVAAMKGNLPSAKQTPELLDKLLAGTVK
ncbi:hypothetical protein GCM10028827_08430 [Mucilaginibacter myungsuensis]